MKAHRLFTITLLVALIAPAAIVAQPNRSREDHKGRSSEMYAGRHNDRDKRVERRKKGRNDRRDRGHRIDDRKKAKAQRYDHRDGHRREHGNEKWRDNRRHRTANTWKNWGTWRRHKTYHPKRYRPIPRAYFPRPGLCRVWYPGRAPGHQPPPVPCAALNGRHLGQVIVLSHKGVVFASHPWYAEHPAYYRHRKPHRNRVWSKSGIVIRLDIGGEWYIGL